MKPNERRAALMIRGIQIKDIALELGIAAPSVSQVMHGIRRTHYVQEAIANAIGKPVEEVFPKPVEEAA